MKRLYILPAILIGCSCALAQTKKPLTFKDAMSPKLMPANLRNLGWSGANTVVWTVPTNSGPEAVLQLNLDTKKTDTLFKADILDPKAKRMPLLSWSEEGTCTFQTGKSVKRYNATTKVLETLAELPDNAENLDIAPNTGLVAYTAKNNVYIQKGKETMIGTFDLDSNIVNGKAVHRNEFGINKGTFWSPDGQSLAFYKMDQRMVTDYPLVDLRTVPARVNLVKYPMAGQTSHEVTLQVFSLLTKRFVTIETGKPADQYLTAITWAPDNQSIFIGILNRDQNYLKMNRYDAITGKYMATLFEEQRPTYVEPESPLLFTPDGKAAVWQSERSGTNQLYLYDLSGKLLKQVSMGSNTVTAVSGFDKEGNLYYTTSSRAGLARQLNKVSLKSGKTLNLTDAAGVHSSSVNKAGAFIDVFSNLTTPRAINVVRGKESQNLLTATNPLSDYQWRPADTLSIKADDGTKLNARLIKPSNFDPNKKYPVVIYVYGGPHAQLVTDSWLTGANLWMHYMAEQGYLVFTMDNRGSANRGQGFEEVTHRQLGEIEMQDQMKGYAYLSSLPFVDANRIGVHGWSFGGFMTTNLMTRFADKFKVGVAGGPVLDWKLYEIMYTERYMDTPAQNPEGYAKNTLTNKAKDLKGKLMLIHGTIDDVVVWQHSQLYVKNAVESGVQMDYFIYPGHAHNVVGPDRSHLIQKIVEYFKANL